LVSDHQVDVLVLPVIGSALVHGDVVVGSQLLGNRDELGIGLRHLQIELGEDVLIVPNGENLGLLWQM
jgi:hypothetical protein